VATPFALSAWREGQPVCRRQDSGSRRKELLLFNLDLPSLMLNEVACSVIEYLAQDPLLVENVSKGLAQVLEA
jgi:hypothetical protein